MTPKRLSESVIVEKLHVIGELLGDLEKIGDASAERLTEDRFHRHGIERVLTQLVELAVAINNHIAVANGFAAGAYKESFFLAARAGVISHELAAELAPSAGMRNILIHEYVHIDLEEVSASIPHARDGYTRYVKEVATYLSRVSSSHLSE